MANKFKTKLEVGVFNIKWFLLIFYAGLAVAMAPYTISYISEVCHLFKHYPHLTIDETSIVVLELIDVVMLANLVKMILTGSYHSFISKTHKYKDEKSSSGIMKIKISTSLMGVCSIHLLQDFLSKSMTWESLNMKLAIFGAFCVGSVVLSVIDYLHVKSEIMEDDMELRHEALKEKDNH